MCVEHKILFFYHNEKKNAYTQRKSNRDIFLFYSNSTHFQSTNIAHMILEVLDLDFDKQMCVVCKCVINVCGYCYGLKKLSK